MTVRLQNIILVIIVIVAKTISGKVWVALSILDYANTQDRTSSGDRCETFHFFDDSCDPVFRVCVTSDDNRRCNLIRETRGSFSNTRSVYNILTRNNIQLPSLPRSLKFNIVVEDHDHHKSNAHIATFDVELKPVNIEPLRRRIVINRNLHTSIVVSASFSCVTNYYGPKCETYCSPVEWNFKCDPKGTKICLLRCTNSGKCGWDDRRNQFKCNCNRGWHGDLCEMIDPSVCLTSKCQNGATCLVYPWARSKLYLCQCLAGFHGDYCQISPSTTTRMSTSTVTTTKMTESPSTVPEISTQTRIYMTKLKGEAGVTMTARNRVALIPVGTAAKSTETQERNTNLAVFQRQIKNSAGTKEKIGDNHTTILVIGAALGSLLTVAVSIGISFLCRRKGSKPSQSDMIICDNVIYETIGVSAHSMNRALPELPNETDPTVYDTALPFLEGTLTINEEPMLRGDDGGEVGQ